MAQQVPDSLLTKKHLNLILIAKISGILSWVVVVFTIVSGWIKILENDRIVTDYSLSHAAKGINPFGFSIIDSLTSSSLLADMIGFILKWAVLFILLRFISQALRMLVETDVNYRLNISEENHNG
jgi:hypothetical protein